MARSRTLRPLRCSLTLATLFVLSASAGCGRTNLSDLIGDNVIDNSVDIDAARELTLADARVVYVELLSPAPTLAHDNLMTARDGIELDALVTRLVPEGDATLILDSTGELPVLKIEHGNSLRALIWI